MNKNFTNYEEYITFINSINNPQIESIELEGLMGTALIDFEVLLTNGEVYNLGFNLATRQINSWCVRNQDTETRRSTITGRKLNEALKDIDRLEGELVEEFNKILAETDDWKAELTPYEYLLTWVGEAPDYIRCDENRYPEIISRTLPNGNEVTYNAECCMTAIFPTDGCAIVLDIDDTAEYLSKYTN